MFFLYFYPYGGHYQKKVFSLWYEINVTYLGLYYTGTDDVSPCTAGLPVGL
jgi:hypothetical protein